MIFSHAESATNGGLNENEHSPQKKPCHRLRDSRYAAYIELIRTCNFGCIAPTVQARIPRRLFPYTNFPKLKTDASDLSNNDKDTPLVPKDGSLASDIKEWTESKWQRRSLHLLLVHAGKLTARVGLSNQHIAYCGLIIPTLYVVNEGLWPETHRSKFYMIYGICCSLLILIETQRSQAFA